MLEPPAELGCRELSPSQEEDAWEAVRALARSGVMGLCGRPDGPPLLPPLSIPARVSTVVDEIERLSRARGCAVRFSWEAALAGRASLLGLRRRGRLSPNGTCRLLKATDGEVALNLPRTDDLELIPALTETDGAGDQPWQRVADLVSRMPAAEFVSRARFLGLAASVRGEQTAEQPYVSSRPAEPRPRRTGEPWTVVDLSSLWAGPVAARVLAESGAQVLKVEDPSRLDGARQQPAFYRWVHPESEANARIDFGSSDGRLELSKLLASADVVIEASRPRALEQIGLSPEQRGIPPGQVWLSITAHGRTGPPRDWTGFGDDTAVAGGLTCRDLDGSTTFCADAVADPITGLIAGLAVLRSLENGGGEQIDISLSGAAAWVTRGSGCLAGTRIEKADKSGAGWRVRAGDRSVVVAESPPHLALVQTA